MDVSRRLALTAAAASLGGCAALGDLASPGAGRLAADKALYIAELAYNGFATSVIALHPTGSALAALKQIDNQAYAALMLARAGRGAAQAVLDAIANARGFMPASVAMNDAMHDNRAHVLATVDGARFLALKV